MLPKIETPRERPENAAEYASLSETLGNNDNRFHTLCIAAEDAMPGNIRLAIAADRRHAM